MPRRCGVLLPAPSLCPRNPEPGNSPLVTPVFGLDGVQRVVKRLATVAGSGSGLFVRWVNPLTPAALPQRGEGRVEFRDLLGDGRVVRGGAYIVVYVCDPRRRLATRSQGCSAQAWHGATRLLTAEALRHREKIRTLT
jgi:hypothetical protein